MGIVDRIKRRLPILGAPDVPPPPRPASSVHPRPAPVEEPEPVSQRGSVPVTQFVDDTVKKNPIVIFMKGSPVAPQCGFSAGAVGILGEYGAPFAHVNVLADPEVREAVKAYSSWPTIPQIFIGGEFVGGADILKQLHASGELKAMIAQATTPGV